MTHTFCSNSKKLLAAAVIYVRAEIIQRIYRHLWEAINCEKIRDRAGKITKSLDKIRNEGYVSMALRLLKISHDDSWHTYRHCNYLLRRINEQNRGRACACAKSLEGRLVSRYQINLISADDTTRCALSAFSHSTFHQPGLFHKLVIF